MSTAVAVVVAGVGALDPGDAAAAPVAAATRPATAVAHLRVSAVSSTSVTLAWTNPRRADFRGVEVRVTNGTRVPATPTSGRHVARVSSAHRSVTLSRLSPGATYSVSVFSTDGHGHFSRRTAIHAVTAPGPVVGLQPYDDGATAVLQWSLPRTRSLRQVVVRYAAGTVAPASVRAGHGVRLTSPTARSARIVGLAKGSRYSVSVFALDGAGRASTPAVTRLLTLGDPERDGAVSGRVTDTSGHPLLGVDVAAVTYDSDAPPAHTTTGSDGRYDLALRGGNWYLTFGGQQITGGTSDATGYVSRPGDAEVSAGRTVVLPPVALDPGAALDGRVVDSGGAPVAATPVSVRSVNAYVQGGNGGGGYFQTEQDSTATPVTAPDGTYTIRGVPAGGAVRWCAGPQDAATCSRSATVPAIGSVRTVADLVISARPGGAISGRVHDGAVGLGGAQVYAESTDQDGSDGARATTGDDGTFHLGNLLPGRYTVCSTSYRGGATGYAATCTTPVTVTLGHVTSTDLPLRRGAAVSGVVTGPGGRPVAGADVSVGPSAPDVDGAGPVSSGQAVTDSRGRYRVTGLDASARQAVCVSTYLPLAHVPNGLLDRCSAVPAVRTGLTRADADVALAAAAAISGRVTDERGHPVPNAVISVTARNAPPGERVAGADDIGFTDQRGYFAVTGLGAYTFRVCVTDVVSGTGGFFAGYSDPDCAGQTVRTRLRARTSVALRTAARTGATVTVRDQAGAPVAGVNAVLVSACTRAESENGDCFATSIGQFDPRRSVQVVGGGVTSSTGVADLTDLLPGHYAVCLFAYYATTTSGGSPTGYADRCSGSTFDVEPTAGRRTTVALTLAPGGVVSGRITDLDGHPLQAAKIRVAGSASTDYPGAQPPSLSEPEDGFSDPGTAEITSADGTYTVSGVAPGRRTVCVVTDEITGGSSQGGYLDQCLGGRPATEDAGTPVTVTASTTVTGVDLALTAGSALSGRVTTTTGAALAGADVEVFSGRDARSDPYTFAESDDAGRWSVDTLPAGTYTVCVSYDDYDEDQAQQYLGQCWKGVNYDDEQYSPPLARATLITTLPGQAVTGLDTALVRHR